MLLARVIGHVWCTRKVATMDGLKLLLIQPIDDALKDVGSAIAAADTSQAGVGDVVMFVTAREAVVAVTGDADHLTPVDAAVTGIVDSVGGHSV
jgi:ethanolamine utilization protein EutN